MQDDKPAPETTEADEIDRLRTMISEAYQVIGALAHYTGTMDHPDVIRALDNFATGGEGPVPHPDLLPWPKTAIDVKAPISRMARSSR